MQGHTRRERPKVAADDLIRQTLALIEADGLEGFTMRRLAASVDVTPMALYWHFKSRAHLLAAVGDHLLGSLDLTEIADDQPWDERIAALRRAVDSAIARAPGAAAIMRSRLPHTPAGRRFIAYLEDGIRDAGVDDECSHVIAAHVIDSVFNAAGPQQACSGAAQSDAILPDSSTETRQHDVLTHLLTEGIRGFVARRRHVAG